MSHLGITHDMLSFTRHVTSCSFDTAIHFCGRAIDLHFWSNVSASDGKEGVGGGSAAEGMEDNVAEGRWDGGGFVQSVKKMREEAEAGLTRRASAAER